MTAALAEINQRENALIRAWGGIHNIPEANADLNNLQREKIAAIHKARGKAYIGKINYDGPARESLTPDDIYEEYTGQAVCNFGACFVVPTTDTELAEMIVQWNKDISLPLLHKITSRVKELGGVNLIWS